METAPMLLQRSVPLQTPPPVPWLVEMNSPTLSPKEAQIQVTLPCVTRTAPLGANASTDEEDYPLGFSPVKPTMDSGLLSMPRGTII